MTIKTKHDWFANTRLSIESGFAQWGDICYRHPLKIIVTVMLLVGLIASYLPTITVDTSTAGFLHADDPVRLTYDDFQREFSRDEKIMVIIEGDVFSITFFERLQQLHQAFEQLDQIAKVDSLVNARLVYGKEDELIVEDLLETFPANDEDIATIRYHVLNNPMYQQRFINQQRNLTSIILTTDSFSRHGNDQNAASAAQSRAERAFITGEEVGDIIDQVDAIIAQNQAPGFDILVGGSPHLMRLLTVILGQDMFIFSMLGVLSIACLLALLYRRWVMVLLPISVSALSTFFTIALMAFLEITVTTSIQILPSFLLAVGVGNSVHIFTAFFQGIDRGLSKEASLHYALGHSGLAVTMTGLTTAGGLLSFISAEIKPVSDFGFITPMGIMCALLFSLVLLPALIALIPIKNKGLKDDSTSWYQVFLYHCAVVSTKYPKYVILAWLVLLLPALLLVSQLRISHLPIEWFPEHFDLRVATYKIDQELGGTAFLEVIVDTNQVDGIKDPEILQRMDAVTEYVLQLNINGLQAGKATSVIDIAKELNKALHGNDADQYVVTSDRQLLAQEFLLYELSGDEDMREIVSDDFSKARMTFSLPVVDAVFFPPYLDALEEGVRKIIDDKAELTFTGVIAMMGRTVVAMLESTVVAYGLAFCIITPLMIFLIGSVKLGLLSMIPNLVPILLTMGLMQAVGIRLDAFTLLIGSIALGLAVDDTIHFMHNYQRYHSQFKDSNRAVFETLKTTGQALMFTTLVLSVAFFINMFATMQNMCAFGLLTGFCIIAAFLSDVLLAPAIMTLVNKHQDEDKIAA